MKKDIIPYKKRKNTMMNFFKLSTPRIAITTSFLHSEISAMNPFPNSTSRHLTLQLLFRIVSIIYRIQRRYWFVYFLTDIKFTNPEIFFDTGCEKTILFSWNFWNHWYILGMNFLTWKRNYVSSRSTLRKSSAIYAKRQKITETVSELVSMIHEASYYKIDHLMTATSISATYMKKAEAIKKIIEIGGRLNILINDKDLKRTLRKRISEYDKVQSNNFIRDPNELHTVLCLNSTQRLWEDVTDEIILCHNSNEKPSPIAWGQLLEISDTILSKVVTKVSELDIKIDTDTCIHQITRLMPTMYVSNSFGGVFINLHEFVLCSRSIRVPAVPRWRWK